MKIVPMAVRDNYMNIQLSLQATEQPLNITLTSNGLTIAPQEAESTPAPTNLEWSDTLLDGDTVKYAKAEKAAQALGDGWRLPTRKELESLVDTSRHDPAIDTDKFPDTKSERYWTSTPCAWNDAAVWVVGFSYGFVDNYLRYYSGCVRAVRSGQ